MVDQSVSVVLDCVFFLLSKTLVVGNVEMSLVSGLLSTCLPDMGAEDVSASSENKVSTCVVSLQLTSALAVNKAGNLAFYDVKISRNLAVDQM